MVLGEDDDQRFSQMRAAVCVFVKELPKIQSPEDLEIEDITYTRVVPRSKIWNEVLVRFGTVSERDEVISGAVNLKDAQVEAGVWLEIPDHLQADFKVLIQYGNDARRHYGNDVRRLVRFFKEEYGLVLHLGLPLGQWLKVTPNKARELGRFWRQKADTAMRPTLSSSRTLDDTLLQEAAATAFMGSSSPVTGAYAVPITSTPTRGPAPQPTHGEDESMPEETGQSDF